MRQAESFDLDYPNVRCSSTANREKKVELIRPTKAAGNILGLALKDRNNHKDENLIVRAEERISQLSSQ